MKRIALAILSIVLYIVLISMSVLFFIINLIIWLLTFWWNKQYTAVYLWTALWASCIIWVNPLWSTKVIDRKKFKRNKQSVIVSNHQSAIDICYVFMMFPIARWISKVENFKVPLFGWTMYLNRAIPLRRGDKNSVLHMFKGVNKAIAQGSSIVMYPEGTRSRDGKLGAFKTGAFEIALRNKIGIQPMVQDGAGRALPKHGWVMEGKHKVITKALDYIPYESFKHMNADELSNHVRELMENAMREINPDYNNIGK